MDQTTTQAVEQAALNTAEQLLPVLIAAVGAGAKAATPQAAVLAMLGEAIPPLVQSFGATSTQITQLLTALAPQLAANQAQFDATAQARGIMDPTQPAAAKS